MDNLTFNKNEEDLIVDDKQENNMTDNNVNLDALNKVEVNNPRNGHSSSYDIRYSVDREKFMISTELWNKLDLDHNGLTVFFTDEDVFVGVSDEEHAKFLTRKKNAETKTHEFTNRKLRALLDERGIDTIDIDLDHVGKKGDYDVYIVKAVEESPTIDSETEDKQETESIIN